MKMKNNKKKGNTIELQLYQDSIQWYITNTGDQREVLGKEPIKITVSLSWWAFIASGFALENSPESNPKGKTELDFLPNKSLAIRLSLLVAAMVFSSPMRAPHVQFVSLPKQGLWNTDSQDVHLSISPSCLSFVSNCQNRHKIIQDNNNIYAYMSRYRKVWNSTVKTVLDDVEFNSQNNVG